MALANTAEIMAAYDAVLANELDWFLLHYPNVTAAADELALYAFGSNGLEELKTKIDTSDIEQVLVGLVRIDDIAIPGAEEETEEELVKYVLISYVPRGVLGVRRARAKVHSRRLGMIFKKHDAVLSVEEVSQLTNTAIAHILAEPDPSLLTFSGPAGVGPSSPPFSTPYTSTASRSDSYNPLPVGSPVAYQQQQQRPHHPPTATDMGRSFSQPVPPVHKGSQKNNSRGLSDLKPIRRSFSETQESSPSSPPGGGGPGLHKMGSNMFSQFLRRKKGSGTGAAALGRGGGDFDESQESEDSMPPPTPPKDKGIYAPPVGMHTSGRKKGKRGKKSKAKYGGVPETGEFMYNVPSPRPHEPPHELSPISDSSFRHLHSVSEFAVVSHEGVDGQQSGDVDVVVVRPDGGFDRFDKPLPLAGQERVEVGIHTLRKGKWAGPQGLSAIHDPNERAWVRMEMQRQKEEERREMIRAEEDRQERVRWEKEESRRREEEEAERRKAEIRAEATRVAAERRRRNEEERQEEERKAREREERKKSERAKRLEEHQRLEEWRRMQQVVAEETARRETEARRREEEKRREKILKVQTEMKQRGKGEGMTGYVTIQTDDSVVWRRRYYKFSPNTFYLYRNEKVGAGQDRTQATDRVDVRSALKALKEPKDGYEDLEAIPFSFVIEFHDRGPWSMYADSEEEKFKLLGLLKYAAGV